MKNEEMEKLSAKREYEYRQKHNELIDQLKAMPERNAFYEALDYGYGSDDAKRAQIIKEYCEGFATGKWSRPSEWLLSVAPWIFDGVILPVNREATLWAIDNINRLMFAESAWRRSFRSCDYKLYVKKVLSFLKEMTRELVEAEAIDILRLNVSMADRAFITRGSYCNGNNSILTAWAIHKHPQESVEAIKQIINGESEIKLSEEIIRGILMSDSRELVDYLGQALVAARLQEGLRQAICENADMGTIENFLSIINVISENDLIRFSSVKRAVGTWTGLMTYDEDALERISRKTLNLISLYLSDSVVRRVALDGEDSMEIYLSLWASGAIETHEAAERVMSISREGTQHQIMTASYLLSNLSDIGLSHKIAKTVFAKRDDKEIVAVYLPWFVKPTRIPYYWSGCKTGHDNTLFDELNLDAWFDSEEEARSLYGRLWQVLETMPAKKIEYNPCIFPWNAESLSRSNIIIKLCFIAYMLGDDNEIDRCALLLGDVEADHREAVSRLLLFNRATEVRRRLFIDMMGDKCEGVRASYCCEAKNVKFSAEEYLMIERLLRYKYSNMRPDVIAILTDRDDADVEGTLQRLLADKKVDMRVAGLDIAANIIENDAKGTRLKQRCRELVSAIAKPTDKERVLIDRIMATGKGDITSDLFGMDDAYIPAVPESGSDIAVELAGTLVRYFPLSGAARILDPSLPKVGSLAKLSVNLSVNNDVKEAFKAIDSLVALMEEHSHDTFTYYGEECTFDCSLYQFFDKETDLPPFMDIWRDWYKTEIKTPERLVRALVASMCYAPGIMADKLHPLADRFYGKGYMKWRSRDFIDKVQRVLAVLRDEYVPVTDQRNLSWALKLWFMLDVDENDVVADKGPEVNRWTNRYTLMLGSLIFAPLIINDYRSCSANLYRVLFDLDNATASRCYQNENIKDCYAYQLSDCASVFGNAPRNASVPEFINAAYRGELALPTLYSCMFGKDLGEYLKNITDCAAFFRERNIAANRRDSQWTEGYRLRRIGEMLGHDDFKAADVATLTDEEIDLLAFVNHIYDTVVPRIVNMELKRGDTETRVSAAVRDINRIYGIEYFVAILKALGKDTIAVGYGTSKRSNLSYLLSVCVPAPDDDASMLAQALKGTQITEQRLLEAALYSSSWLDIVEELLGWRGFKSTCHWFIAHTSEQLNERQMAVINRYTPLSADELSNGAFDVAWFKSAYKEIGRERFDMLYDAAKYIAEGNRHTRARKFADAALGRIKAKDAAGDIAAKRNKDLVMAYALIPLKGKKDLPNRYRLLMQFLKESKQFGAQRMASEKKAVDMALRNLAASAGYADSTRLTISMEAQLVEENRDMFADVEISGVAVRIDVDQQGKAAIVCTKDGKRLNSVPAKLKKEKYIQSLQDMVKTLKEQRSRTCKMMEQAMEDGVSFSAGEIAVMASNPVLKPLIGSLVFRSGDCFGRFLGTKIVDFTGEITELGDEDSIVVAHPVDLRNAKVWLDWQRILFEQGIVQPFKQVFREVYVKTVDETGAMRSLRYAGNQIQPKKAAACLKGRRWVVDVETGLQKVFYKENIVAHIYALADWFSPADIESPTLEWVVFTDSRTGKDRCIDTIPDIIFSEVMRDVDLAVSVAHAGGVDPETSHSTIEMREALLKFTLPMLNVENVEIEGRHAHIKGTRNCYTVHLGSGVVHQRGGAMINILPVYSQHRGRIFLPFADDDPKTSEIISKVLLLADDKKIQDPCILSQIEG